MGTPPSGTPTPIAIDPTDIVALANALASALPGALAPALNPLIAAIAGKDSTKILSAVQTAAGGIQNKYVGITPIADVLTAIANKAIKDPALLTMLEHSVDKTVDAERWAQDCAKGMGLAAIEVDKNKVEVDKNREDHRHTEATQKQTDARAREVATEALDGRAMTMREGDASSRRAMITSTYVDSLLVRNDPNAMHVFDSIVNRIDPPDMAAIGTEVVSKCPGISQDQLTAIYIAVGARHIDMQAARLNEIRERNRANEARVEEGNRATEARNRQVDDNALAVARETNRQTNLSAIIGGIAATKGLGIGKKQLKAFEAAMAQA